MSHNKKYGAELSRLMFFLADSVGEMNDAQIEEEYSKEGEPRTKEVFRNVLRGLRQKKLREARRLYDSASSELSARSYDLPRGSSEQRKLLALILSRHPDLRSLAVTAHHRDLEDLTDSDIASFLRQLAALGLLEHFRKDE